MEFILGVVFVAVVKVAIKKVFTSIISRHIYRFPSIMNVQINNVIQPTKKHIYLYSKCFKLSLKTEVDQQNLNS